MAPVLPSGFEATYYELQIVLEITCYLKVFLLSLAFGRTPSPRPTKFSKPNLGINPITTARQHPFTNWRNPTWRLQQTLPILQSSRRLRHNNAWEVIESNCAAKAFRPLPMKCYSASRRCISIKALQHSEIAPFSLSSVQKPHRRSTWQMASTISSRATSQKISTTTTEHMKSVCSLLIVRHASLDLIVQALFTSIKEILSSHLTLMHAKQLRNHTSQQSNRHTL